MQTEKKKKGGKLMVDRMDNRKSVKLTRSEEKSHEAYKKSWTGKLEKEQETGR